MKSRYFLMGCIILAMTSFSYAWDTLTAVSVCTGGTMVTLSDDFQMTSDGYGGAILVWSDSRRSHSFNFPDIYAQRIDSTGTPLWTMNGIPICTTAYESYTPQLVGDGSGGAYISWTEMTAPSAYPIQIYGQYINSQGSTLWNPSGIKIGNNTVSVWASDSQGGGYCGVGPLLRINSDGSTLWSLYIDYTHMISDGNGGLIMAWTNIHTYAQRVNSDGTLAWPTTGTSKGKDVGSFSGTIGVYSDGSSGCLITCRSGNNVIVQHVDSLGTTLWSTSGIVVCTTAGGLLGSQTTPAALALSDQSSGAYVTWEDYRSTSTFMNYAAHIFMQRVNSEGSTLWTINGTPLYFPSPQQAETQVLPDGSGGQILSWTDTNLLVQRIDSNANLLWSAPTGSVVKAITATESGKKVITANNNGGIIAWREDAGFYYGNVFIQSFGNNGQVVPVELSNFEVDEKVKTDR